MGPSHVLRPRHGARCKWRRTQRAEDGNGSARGRQRAALAAAEARAGMRVQPEDQGRRSGLGSAEWKEETSTRWRRGASGLHDTGESPVPSPSRAGTAERLRRGPVGVGRPDTSRPGSRAVHT